MAYPTPDRLWLPLAPYQVGGYAFGERLRRHVVLWAYHLGDDVAAAPGTPVVAAGDGVVVLAKTLLGSQEHRSWGGLVLLGHQPSSRRQPMRRFRAFYSVYGHLSNLRVQTGELVAGGQILGEVAAGLTAENGWWQTPHLHFALYTGPWQRGALPGYWRCERWWQTARRWWHDPQKFIEEYNQD